MRTDVMNNPSSESRSWLWTVKGFEPTEGVPITDRGFRYGMSVFESFPVRDGVGVFLEKHLERLRAACRLTGLAEPPGALDKCKEVIEKAGDGFARIYVTAGDGPVTAACDACRMLILVEPRQPIGGGTYHRGYPLGIRQDWHLPLFGGIKTGNYWGNLRAFREGVAARCNEMLLFNSEGQLISACMANVFLVKEGRIQTPALSTGARAGIVREWVMERVAVTEAILTKADLDAAEELFLTSSWLGIMSVAFLELRPMKIWTVSARLRDEYRKDVYGNCQ